MNTKLHARMDKQKVSYLRQGNYTVALLYGPLNKVKAIGIAKRNPNADADIPERGQEIALARALKNAGFNG